MAAFENEADESLSRPTGSIPGTPGHPAFTFRSPQPSSLPVLISVPHAGRIYPEELTSRMRQPRTATLRLEDRYADLLGLEVADATGAGLLVAQAPRAMIDLNRAADDIDWGMFERGRRGAVAIGPRARSGLGLIPRRLPGSGEIWRGRHKEADLDERIAAIHTPYHARLAQELEGLRRRWGAALLIDLHSMPPLSLRGPHPPSEFVVGDRFGLSCDGSLIASAFGYFAIRGRTAGHNRPYAGGYVLDRHAATERNIHAIQLEIDRTSYLDTSLTEPGDGFADMIELLSGLVGTLAAHVAELGAGHGQADEDCWADAAE